MSEDVRAQIHAMQTVFEERPEGLLRHVQRVLVEALDLAGRYDLDRDRVELATWGHDLFRSFPPEEQLRLAVECGLPIEEADRADPVLLQYIGGKFVTISPPQAAVAEAVWPMK